MEKPEVELERFKAGLQNFLEMNKHAADFAKRSIQGAFLLNGGAATALLASKGASFADYACLFGFGAFLAVGAMALGYGTNLTLAESWQCYLEERTTEQHRIIYQRYKRWLWCSVATGVLSGACFLGTLMLIYASFKA
jgi:hypothetical protein